MNEVFGHPERITVRLVLVFVGLVLLANAIVVLLQRPARLERLDQIRTQAKAFGGPVLARERERSVSNDHRRSIVKLAERAEDEMDKTFDAAWTGSAIEIGLSLVGSIGLFCAAGFWQHQGRGLTRTTHGEWPDGNLP